MLDRQEDNHVDHLRPAAKAPGVIFHGARECGHIERPGRQVQPEPPAEAAQLFTSSPQRQDGDHDQPAEDCGRLDGDSTAADGDDDRMDEDLQPTSTEDVGGDLNGGESEVVGEAEAAGYARLMPTAEAHGVHYSYWRRDERCQNGLFYM